MVACEDELELHWYEVFNQLKLDLSPLYRNGDFDVVEADL